MSNIFQFTSVHEYLDQVFKDIAPSKEMITLAKKDYWRAYNTDLKRRQRKEFSTLHLRFTKAELQQFKTSLSKEESINSKVKQILKNYLYEVDTSQSTINTALIEQQVFLISEYIEEWREENEVDIEKLQQLESCILAIEKAITDDH